MTTEAQFAEQVLEIAKGFGWLWHHDRGDYRNCIAGDAGFPDYVFSRDERLLIVELKSETGKTTAAQQRWIESLQQAERIYVDVWRPSQIDDIARFLSRRPR